MSPSNHVVIFARAPRLGRGKRRLAREAGDLAALRFQRLNIARVLRRLAGDPRWTTWLAVTPDTAATDQRSLWRSAARIIPQGRGDLGTRMAAAMAARPPGPVVIVGSDIPGIRAHHVAGAFAALGRHDAVLGPADDGGYWLIGMRRRPVFRPPFDGVRWGTAHALADTRANLRRQGQSVALLEVLADVDTAEDLHPGLWR
jgi:hypothetical protein